MVAAALAAAVLIGGDGGGEPGARAAPAGRAPGTPPLTLAVIGDTPYGAAQEAAFPRLVADVDADPDVDLVLHLGDIKSGASTCTDARLVRLKALFDTFADPFVYTPGDNEWTDCHNAIAGAFEPTERLRAVRRIFFPRRGFASGGGRALRVRSQAGRRRFGAYVENQMLTRARVVVATVHVVGSNNGLAPWSGGAETAEQRAGRLTEFGVRQAANLAWIDATFAAAARRGALGVIIAMQADTFPFGTPDGSAAVVERIATRARRFRGPVLLLQGDTHRFVADRPLPSVPNVRRVVVEGETAGEWLRVDVEPRTGAVFAATRERLP